MLDPITLDACTFFGQQALIKEHRIVRDADDAAKFAAAFGDKRVAIRGGHGIFTTGRTVDEAARSIASTLGSSSFGWLSFQTLWDEIIASDPDLTD